MAKEIFESNAHNITPFIDPHGRLSGTANGKSVVVSGAGGLIGRGYATAFALAGASHLTLVGRRASILEETRNAIRAVAPETKVLVVSNTDISKDSDVSSLFSKVKAEFGGPPDILINNAAISGTWLPFAQQTPSQWWEVQEINMRGTINMCHAYITALTSNAPLKEGLIINVSSVGSYAYLPGISAYANSKAAMNNFTEYIDSENAGAHAASPSTIPRITAIPMHPGGVQTEMAGVLPKELFDTLRDSPELAGGVAVWLSAEGRWLGGRFVSANWDMEKVAAEKERILKGELLKLRVVGCEQIDYDAAVAEKQ
ncbi:hypothetical protein LTR95_007341 [Oleoguttula sp. CCFEE 5521]